ncbi:SGNH/GDSL hydrolase family protein [Staphylococcus chromogenes]|nr:SGNH/GDSL hydrolase family protein [Staphylococcus chromogenes]
MGDSYTSGPGLRPYDEDAPQDCRRSTRNFAKIFAKSYTRLKLKDVSCAGAASPQITGATSDQISAQVAALSDETDLVTITLGGNDRMLFSELAICNSNLAEAFFSTTGIPNYCTNSAEHELQMRIDEIAKLDVADALTAVRRSAPNAKVVFVGYPRIFPRMGKGCSSMPYPEASVKINRAAEERLNARLREVAEQNGAEFVDMHAISPEEGACAPKSQRFVNPFPADFWALINAIFGNQDLVHQGLHPTPLGHEAIANAVADAVAAKIGLS